MNIPQLATFKNLVRRLHRDEAGQLMPIILFGMIGMTLLLIMVMNTGAMVQQRSRVQNGADAAALTQAAWTARALNVMAMNNVGQTQVMTVAAVATAVNLASAQLAVAIADVIAACGRLIWPPAVAACMQPAQYAAASLAVIQIGHNPIGRAIEATRLVGMFNRMNQHMVADFPRFSGAIAATLAERNGLSGLHFDPTCQEAGDAALHCTDGNTVSGTPLPLVANHPLARIDMCLAAEGELAVPTNERLNFRRHGFAAGTGPYDAGGEGGQHLRDWVHGQGSLPGIGYTIGIFYHVYAYFPVTADAVYRHYPRYQNIWGEWNDWYGKMDATWSGLCGANAALGVFGINLAGMLPNPYWLKGKLDFSTTRPEMLGILALAAGPGLAPVLPEQFGQPLGGHYAYAQAHVFNPASFDLYTQDWQAKLAPATRLAEPATVAQGLNHAPATFLRLQQMLGEIGQGEAADVVMH